MQIKKFIVIPLLLVMLASSCSLLPIQKVSPEVEKELYKTKLMLETEVYSKQQLLDKLVIESDLSVPECQYVVDNCGADWKEMAYKELLPYIRGNIHESRKYYIDRLTYKKFTQSEIDYALNKSGFDWNEEAKLYAQRISSEKSEIEVRDYLRNENFTEDNIEYAMENCGIDWNEQAFLFMSNYRHHLDPRSQYYVSKEEFIKIMVEEHKFTQEQAEYGINKILS